MGKYTAMQGLHKAPYRQKDMTPEHLAAYKRLNVSERATYKRAASVDYRADPAEQKHYLDTVIKMGTFNEYKRKVAKAVRLWTVTHWSPRYIKRSLSEPLKDRPRLLSRKYIQRYHPFKHLDHRLSVRDAWESYVEADLAGHWLNLRWVSPQTNLKKGRKSIINSHELDYMYWNSPISLREARHNMPMDKVLRCAGKKNNLDIPCRL
jgi:hypothetical protein